MKMHGKKIDRVNQEIIAIPRADGDDIIFIAKAVISYAAFNAVCPEPVPGTKIIKGGEKVLDLENPTYKASLNAYATKRYSWLLLESIKDTPGLEWETVDMADASTWGNFETELKASGFSDIEIGRIVKGVSDANCLNEQKVEAARQRFLVGTQVAQ